MKKIKFNKLTITNFRNINNLEFDFNDDITEISGRNGLGKTNTLSAIMWCLFGKDIYDTKQFVISPIIDGKEDNSINTVVKMVVNDNYVIERSYKDRKTDLKTGWIIDGKESLVSITQAKYSQELIENLVDEETFKSLSNINYIPSLNWKDLKKLIFDLIGDISDDEVLLRDDFNLIEEYVRKFGIDETQRLLKTTDSELNDDIKSLETKYQTLLNTKEKYVVDEKDTEKLKTRKQEIEMKLYDIQIEQEKFRDDLETYSNKRHNIAELEQSATNIKNKIEFNNNSIKDYDDLYKANAYDVELMRKNDITAIENDITRMKSKKAELETNISWERIQLENIKKQGEELKAKEIKVENDTCSTCGQHLPEEKIQETLNKLKEQQIKDLQDLKTQYEDKKGKINLIQSDINNADDFISMKAKELEEVKIKEYPTIEETDKQKQLRVAKEEKELENKQLEKELAEKETQLEILKDEFDKLEEPSINVEDTSALRVELNTINDKLATTITLNKISNDIEETNKELENKRNNKVINKDKLQQVVKFNNVKADLLQQRVRNYFKVLCFKTKDYTQTGEEVETFVITNSKGVSFKETNSGDRIALGLDLLQGIMKAKEIYTPIILDNFETYTGEVNCNDSQVIVARVDKNKEKLEVK